MSSPTLIKESLPLMDKSSSSIVHVVQEILKQPDVVRFVVDARENAVNFWRVASEEEAAERTMTFRDALRKVQMEEYSPPPGEKSSFEQVFDVFEMIEDAGCLPSHVLSGRGLVELRSWIPVSRRARMLYGVPLLLQADLENDVLVFCGAKTSEATPSDIVYAVKVTIP